MSLHSNIFLISSSLLQISPFLFHLPSIKSPPAYFISLLSNPSLLISSLLLQISPFFPASFKFLHFSFMSLHSNTFLISSSLLQISPFLFHLPSIKSPPAYFISLLSNPSLLISSLLLQISPFFPASSKFLHFSFMSLHSNTFLISSSLLQISPFLFHLPSIKSPPAYFISLLSNPSLLISSLLLQISPFFPASFKFLHFSFIPLHSNIFLILSSLFQISPFLFHLSSSNFILFILSPLILLYSSSFRLLYFKSLSIHFVSPLSNFSQLILFCLLHISPYLLHLPLLHISPSFYCSLFSSLLLTYLLILLLSLHIFLVSTSWSLRECLRFSYFLRLSFPSPSYKVFQPLLSSQFLTV